MTAKITRLKFTAYCIVMYSLDVSYPNQEGYDVTSIRVITHQLRNLETDQKVVFFYLPFPPPSPPSLPYQLSKIIVVQLGEEVQDIVAGREAVDTLFLDGL